MRITVKNRQDLFDDVQTRFRSWRMFKLPFEGNMFLNVAFFYGFQWTAYNTLTGELQEVENPAGLVRITSNQIQPRIRNLHAKMTKSNPQIDAVPDDWSEKAFFTSRVSQKLIDSWQRELEKELDLETIDWLLITADCFRKIGWDPTDGEAMQVPEDQFLEYAGLNPETGLSEMTNIDAQQGNVNFKTGEIFDDVVPPFEIYAPEHATSLRDCGELMHVKLMPLDDVRDKWGSRKTKDIAPTKEIHMGNYFQSRLLGMANQDLGSSTGISEALLRAKELVYVKELWKAPSNKHPKGQLTILVGEGTEGIMYAEDNPYYEAWQPEGILKEQGYIPFVNFKAVDAPGRFWNIGPVEGMRPLQAEYNRIISDIVQNRITVGRNKIIAPKTANLDEEEVANIHGQFLQFNGIVPPQVFPAQPLPAQTEREIERNSQDMDTISGSHEVSRAQVPSGVKSGIAINYLLEQDDTTLGPVIGNFELSKLKLTKAKLGLAKHFYLEDRLISEVNTDDPVEAYTFRGSDLTTKIRLVPGSALPQSRAALQAVYMDLYERGAIIDELGNPSPNKLFKALRNVLPVDAFFEEQTIDNMRAKRENVAMAGGAQMRPMHWEDHRVHIEAHNKFRKSDHYYILMQQNPQIAQMFDMHVSEHMMFLAPPTPTPGAEEQLMGGQGPMEALPDGGASGMMEDANRISPSVAGQGAMGALQNPTGNYTSSMGGR